jgi:ABC-2 type transport system ATP-binding protein
VRLEVEISPEALTAALHTLADMADAREIAQAGEDPVISLSLTQRDQVPEMVGRLVAAGVPLYRLTPMEPTLEDIYFALHEGNHEEVQQ